MAGVVGVYPDGLTLAELIPMARGAWSKTAWIVVEICNSIPKFGKGELVDLNDVDPFHLYDNDSSSDRVSYDPAVLQALQDAAGE